MKAVYGRSIPIYFVAKVFVPVEQIGMHTHVDQLVRVSCAER